MAANTVPVFTYVANVGSKLTSTTSNAALSGTALANATGAIVTGGANGTLITKILVIATGTSLVGTVNIFVVDNAGSPNFDLLVQVPIAAQTLTTGTPQTPYSIPYNFVLPSGWSIQATQTCAGTQIACNVQVFGEDF